MCVLHTLLLLSPFANYLLILLIKYSRKQNASSKLFRLPLEIRREIYSHLIGDRLIRIYYDTIKTATVKSTSSGPVRQDKRLDHYVCGTGYTMDNRWMLLPGRNYECRSLRWLMDRVVHYCCNNLGDHNDLDTVLSFVDKPPRICLSVIRVCHQIYLEASQVLWTTNTFSFNDAWAFRVFVEGNRRIQGLQPWQRRAWKNIHLDIMVQQYDFGWECVLQPKLLLKLTGLRDLRLRIEHKMTADAYATAKNPFSIVKVAGLWRPPLLYKPLSPFSYSIGLKRLSILPWTDVEVVVRDHNMIKDVSAASGDDRSANWTTHDKIELAALYRACILDKNGGQAYDYDRKAAQVAKKEHRSPGDAALTDCLGFINGRLATGFSGYERLLQEIRTLDERGYETQIQELLANGWSKLEAPIELAQRALLSEGRKRSS